MKYESNKQLRYKALSGNENAVRELEQRKYNTIDTGLLGLSNEKIVYCLPNDIKKQISKLDFLYNKVKINEHKFSRVMLLDSYYSATIEGARTTVEHIENIVNKKESIRSKDDKMVINTLNATSYALRQKFSVSSMLNTWKIVGDGVLENASKQGGTYRSGMVYVGSESRIVHIPARPEQIEQMINSLHRYMNSTDSVIIKAIIYHLYYVYVHPMCDGNGRVARIMMISYLSQNGYPKMPYVPIIKSINEHLNQYYKTLENSEKPDDVLSYKTINITEHIVYMLNIFEEALNYSLVTDVELNDWEVLLVSRMRKNGKGEITANKCSKMLKISKQDSLKLLNNLTRKGYLSKRRSNMNYYKLNI